MAKVAQRRTRRSSVKTREGAFFKKEGDHEGRFFSGPESHDPLQAKLKIGRPGDKYEQEADRMADKVTSQTDSDSASSVRESLPQNRIQGGFFKKLWKKVKKVAKKIGGGIKKAGKKVWGGLKKAGKWLKKTGKKVWGGLKKAGRWLKKTGKKIWNGVKWFGKQLWSKIKGIFHRVKRWITQLPARLGRLVKHLWKGVKSLKPWSLKWWKSLGKASTWKDFGKWLGEFAIYAAEVAGIPEIYETIADFLKFNTRPLTSGEIATAKSVFGNGIDYALVRVDERALLGPSWTGRAYVSFHTINSWGKLDNETLIHELTHVWQYEKMGAMYMPRAIHAQKTGGYNYGGITALEANKAKGMAAFNLEQQGEILSDYYKIKNGMAPDWGSGTAADLPLYEIYVSEAKR